MRLSRFFPLIIALDLLAACGSSATAGTRSYSVTDFRKIRVQGPFDVHVHVGMPSAAKATATPAMLDRLSIEVQGDTLVIKPLPGGWGGWPGGDQGKVLIDVGTRIVSGVTLAGSGDVSVDKVHGDTLDLALAGSGDLTVGTIDVTRLGAAVTGSGDLTVAGRAADAKAILTGSGDIHGDAFAAEQADVSLVGSGDLTLGAKHTAKVSLAGSGNVTIAGPAACTISRSGSGEVRCAHQNAGAD